jgi:hypothetical protein
MHRSLIHDFHILIRKVVGNIFSAAIVSVRRHSVCRVRLQQFSVKKCHLSKLYCFRRFLRYYRIRSCQRSFSKFVSRFFDYRIFGSAFSKWKHEVSRAIFFQHLQSGQSALSECQQSTSELSTQLVSFERYRNTSLVKLGETRKRFVILDDISQEIYKICGNVHSLSNEAPAPLYALSNDGQLAELETALVSLGTCLSPWVRPRLDLSLVNFVESLRTDLMAVFEHNASMHVTLNQ